MILHKKILKLCIISAVSSSYAYGQEGPIHKQWTPSKQPDGKVEAIIPLPASPDGAPADPEGCKVLGEKGCLKILCKAEAAIYDNSPQGRSAASNRARIWAKSHYLQFMKDSGKVQEATEQLADESRKEGVTSTSYVDSLKKAAQFASQGNISGFAIIEDGTDNGMRYAIGGTSCITLNAARDAQKPSTAESGTAGTGQDAPQARRRSTGNF